MSNYQFAMHSRFDYSSPIYVMNDNDEIKKSFNYYLIEESIDNLLRVSPLQYLRFIHSMQMFYSSRRIKYSTH